MAYPHDQYAAYSPPSQYHMSQVPSASVYSPLDGAAAYPTGSRPSSFMAPQQQQNAGFGTGSSIHLASQQSSSGTDNNFNHQNTPFAADPPYTSPGLSDPGFSPSSAVPLLFNNAGYSSNTNNTTYAPYSPPPDFATPLASPSIQKTLSATLPGFGKSAPKQNGPKIAQRRLSSFKHTDYEYRNNPAIRQAYLSPRAHFLSIWLPFVGFILIMGGMWGMTIACQVSKPGHMIEVNSQTFYEFGLNQPTLLVAAFTFIGSLLNAFLLWCFACAVLSYSRYRISLGRPISLKGLSALSSAKMGEFAMFSQALTSKWGWLCLVCWGCFLASSAGFNTILLPTRRTITQAITATELDMTSDSFAAFYRANTAPGTGTYYDCYRWTPVRGIAVSPCPAGTAFTATAYGGRAHFESQFLKQLTYIRLAQVTYTGSTWGTLPFTSFNPALSKNTFDSTLKRYPGGKQNFTIGLTNQGMRATIICGDETSSPLSMSTTLPAGTSPLPCNPDTPVVAISPDLRMRAGYCNSTIRPADGTDNPYPSYDFFMRFNGDYVHRGADGQMNNENITCRITPFPTTEWSEFKSFDNATWVARSKKPQPTKMYPQALVERILSNLVDMMTVFGQNSVDNLIAEQFVQLTTSYFDGDSSTWPYVAELQLEGMFTFLASYERVLAESLAQGDPEFERITQTGNLQHDTFAFAVEWPTYVLIVPITIACLLGMWFLLKSASFRHVPRFDPLNSTSLIAASAASSHSLFLDDAALKGAAPDDNSANEAHVAFVRDDNTGQWGLERVPC